LKGKKLQRGDGDGDGGGEEGGERVRADLNPRRAGRTRASSFTLDKPMPGDAARRGTRTINKPLDELPII